MATTECSTGHLGQDENESSQDDEARQGEATNVTLRSAAPLQGTGTHSFEHLSLPVSRFLPGPGRWSFGEIPLTVDFFTLSPDILIPKQLSPAEGPVPQPPTCPLLVPVPGSLAFSIVASFSRYFPACWVQTRRGAPSAQPCTHLRAPISSRCFVLVTANTPAAFSD